MRKWLILILIGWLALIPAAAFADVDIDVDIHKTKDKTVKEKLLKFKAALILALVVQITDKAAESETLVNQTNENNFEFDLVHKSKSEAKSIAGAGITSMFLVAWVMRGLSRLQASGTVNVRNAVGTTGTVYLRIPAHGTGRGKVTVEVQGRSMEFPAVTDGDTLETGTQVTVEAVEGEDLLKVARS